MVLALDATRPDLWRSMHCSQCRPVKRDFLVVLPAGPDFDASKWMGRPQHANWDLGGRSRVRKALHEQGGTSAGYCLNSEQLFSSSCADQQTSV